MGKTMTSHAEAQQLRARIYDLKLVGASQVEIARTVNLSESQVSRHFTRIRQENIEWFETHKEPDSRLREFYKEAVDRANRLYREAWARYATAIQRQERPPNDQAIQGYLNVIMKATVELRVAQCGTLREYDLTRPLEKSWLERPPNESSASYTWTISTPSLPIACVRR